MGDAISAIRRPVVILSTTASTFFFFAISSSVRCSLDFAAISASIPPPLATVQNLYKLSPRASPDKTAQYVEYILSQKNQLVNTS